MFGEVRYATGYISSPRRRDGFARVTPLIFDKIDSGKLLCPIFHFTTQSSNTNAS
ncbi:hypothetical protein Pla100_35640 [Neorhodopirellula pilleata]|uniref:Uncharacterized protein n=1 Tax=Neorhodopirellula pilleata TaxID=2714738 RepID=A0A5C6A6H4_9BACT|nr:hypothetical protein Pla100_35640 [Neorhodopirellula pilleata]